MSRPRRGNLSWKWSRSHVHQQRRNFFCVGVWCAMIASGHILRYNPSELEGIKQKQVGLLLYAIDFFTVYILETFFCTGDVLGFLCLNDITAE